MTPSPAPPATGRAWHLVARPHGRPRPEDFALREVPVPAPGPGEVLIRNHFFSVDPYMRGRMGDTNSYVYFPPMEIGEIMGGAAAGEVIASADPSLAVGDLVVHFGGWREYALLPATGTTPVDTRDVPLSAHLGVLGMTGLSAYAGLFEVAGFRPGDAVFVSGAAGAVGGQAGQMARLAGASRVIGSAGSAEKVKHLVDDLGFDAAFNYKDGPVLDQLRAAAPDGIDVYFDTVGGDHLEAAIDVLREHGRITLCGAIAQYNDIEPPPGPRNLPVAIGKRLHLHGMLVLDHEDLRPRFTTEVTAWIAAGDLTWRESVVEGIEHGVDAFLGLFRGDNIGKTVVALRP